MKIHYIVPGKKRKELAQTIADWLGETCRYKGVPSYAYEVDNFTIDREGNLLFDDMADSEVIENLLDHLHDEGFEFDLPQYVREPQESVINDQVSMEDCSLDYLTLSDTESQGKNEGLTVAIPIEKIKIGNLTNLLDAKGNLIKNALGIAATPIEIGEDRVSFPWFSEGLDAESIQTYTRFIAALCKMSFNQKRIQAKEKEVDNEKYAFRCFLLRLGFIGNEYKADRKLLLKNLEGSAAFKNGAKGGEE